MNPSVVRKMSPKPATVADVSRHGLTIDQKIDMLFSLFDKHGQMNYVGENVTQMQHAQQVSQYSFVSKLHSTCQVLFACVNLV